MLNYYKPFPCYRGIYFAKYYGQGGGKWCQGKNEKKKNGQKKVNGKEKKGKEKGEKIENRGEMLKMHFFPKRTKLSFQGKFGKKRALKMYLGGSKIENFSALGKPPLPPSQITILENSRFLKKIRYQI